MSYKKPYNKGNVGVIGGGCGNVGVIGGGTGTSSCQACGEVGGAIEIQGSGMRGGLAEMFLTGGTIELTLNVSVDSQCGQVDKISLEAEGEAVMQTGAGTML